MALSRKPPAGTTGMVGWLRQNLFNSVTNSLITVVTGALILWLGYSLITWTLQASWQQVWNNLKLFSVYRYPFELLWRPILFVGLSMGLLGFSAGAIRDGVGKILKGAFWQFLGLLLLITVVAFIAGWSVQGWWLAASALAVLGFFTGRALPSLASTVPWLWLGFAVLGFMLIYGLPGVRSGALRIVPVREWGGFMLTFVLSTGIIVSFPLGVALALGRRSKLPAIKYFCIGFIELIRGAPLITWLFIAALLVPLLLNIDTSRISALLKAYVAVTAFSAAYMAENVRGGLQAIPKGQPEAARALGLSGWQTTRLIVLPQALKAVIPAIVGQAIGLFKDTSLVFIVALFDFFNVHNVVAQQVASREITGGIRLELSLFLAVFYFFFAFRMSLASRQLEEQLGVGTR